MEGMLEHVKFLGQIYTNEKSAGVKLENKVRAMVGLTDTGAEKGHAHAVLDSLADMTSFLDQRDGLESSTTATDGATDASLRQKALEDRAGLLAASLDSQGRGKIDGLLEELSRANLAGKGSGKSLGERAMAVAASAGLSDTGRARVEALVSQIQGLDLESKAAPEAEAKKEAKEEEAKPAAAAAVPREKGAAGDRVDVALVEFAQLLELPGDVGVKRQLVERKMRELGEAGKLTPEGAKRITAVLKVLAAQEAKGALEGAATPAAGGVREVPDIAKAAREKREAFEAQLAGMDRAGSLSVEGRAKVVALIEQLKASEAQAIQLAAGKNKGEEEEVQRERVPEVPAEGAGAADPLAAQYEALRRQVECSDLSEERRERVHGMMAQLEALQAQRAALPPTPTRSLPEPIPRPSSSEVPKAAPVEITNTFAREPSRGPVVKASNDGTNEVELPTGMLDIMEKLQQSKGEAEQLAQMQNELLEMRAEIIARAERERVAEKP